ncbi:Helix-turn-helix domain-containing protein [Novosphingobium sp. CF614]|nr:Helix-turn-helix domain-containing protein [Novosphingobium sp. CF614]
MLIAKDHGHPLAVKVSEWFIRSAPRQSDARQRQDFAERFGTHNPRVLKVLVLLHDTIDTPPTRSELAHAAGVCVRQIERLFRAELGMSVREAGEAIRLDHAAHLLKSTGQSVTAVALACGFASASHFSRAFKQSYAVSPRHWKAHKAAVTAIPDQELARIESLRDRKTRAMSL